MSGSRMILGVEITSPNAEKVSYNSFSSSSASRLPTNRLAPTSLVFFPSCAALFTRIGFPNSLIMFSTLMACKDGGSSSKDVSDVTDEYGRYAFRKEARLRRHTVRVAQSKKFNHYIFLCLSGRSQSEARIFPHHRRRTRDQRRCAGFAACVARQRQGNQGGGRAVGRSLT